MGKREFIKSIYKVNKIMRGSKGGCDSEWGEKINECPLKKLMTVISHQN